MSNKELNIDREEALDILDRIIGFINNCDNKASIALGVFGVVLTIMFTCGGIEEVSKIIDSATKGEACCGWIYIIFLTVFIVAFLAGIYKLFRVLVPNLKPKKLDSNIFFGSISENKSWKKYRKKLLKTTEKKQLDDIIAQIHNNSVICNQKFSNFKIGYIFAGIGSLGIMLMYIIGHFVYQG